MMIAGPGPRGRRARLAWAIVAAATLGASSCARGAAETVAPGTPTLHDTRLQITLFAAEPDIVTPIGIAVDRADRVFVLDRTRTSSRATMPDTRAIG